MEAERQGDESVLRISEFELSSLFLWVVKKDADVGGPGHDLYRCLDFLARNPSGKIVTDDRVTEDRG